jgi:hypothetical protein
MSTMKMNTAEAVEQKGAKEAKPQGVQVVMTRSTVPQLSSRELAKELLDRFPGVDRAGLLEDLVALCFMNLKHGNKREEREACDVLNHIQDFAAVRLEVVRRMDAVGLKTTPEG